MTRINIASVFKEIKYYCFMPSGLFPVFSFSLRACLAAEKRGEEKSECQVFSIFGALWEEI